MAEARARIPFRAAHYTGDSPEVTEQVNALERALMVCSEGDVPDWPRGILGNLMLDGWTLTRTKGE